MADFTTLRGDRWILYEFVGSEKGGLRKEAGFTVDGYIWRDSQTMKKNIILASKVALLTDMDNILQIMTYII